MDVCLIGRWICVWRLITNPIGSDMAQVHTCRTLVPAEFGGVFRRVGGKHSQVLPAVGSLCTSLKWVYLDIYHVVECYQQKQSWLVLCSVSDLPLWAVVVWLRAGNGGRGDTRVVSMTCYCGLLAVLCHSFSTVCVSAKICVSRMFNNMNNIILSFLYLPHCGDGAREAGFKLKHGDHRYMTELK